MAGLSILFSATSDVASAATLFWSPGSEISQQLLLSCCWADGARDNSAVEGAWAGEVVWSFAAPQENEASNPGLSYGQPT